MESQEFKRYTVVKTYSTAETNYAAFKTLPEALIEFATLSATDSPLIVVVIEDLTLDKIVAKYDSEGIA